MDDLALARGAIRRWFDAAVDAVEPRKAVARALSFEDGVLHLDHRAIPLSENGRVVVIAIGKAASGMAQGAVDVLGDRIDSGVILTKYGHLTTPVEGFSSFEAGHPVPDESGMAATREVLALVDGLTEDDIVIALISGGGSALLELPVSSVSLDDLRETTQMLMHAGAGIHDLNAVRKALSRVKGGGLRRAIGPARCVTLLLSDVLGNDPEVIASGPTVTPSGPLPDAAAIIDRFGVRERLPHAVSQALVQPVHRDTGVDPRGDVVSVIADNAAFVQAIAQAARDERLRVHIEHQPFDGDARDLGMDFVRRAQGAPEGTDMIVRGGEATVIVRGDGTGGRNTEMALAAAQAMTGDVDWIVASLASDGDDGNSGAAGAIADGTTASRALEAGVDPAAALARNDSATVFRAAGGLVETGPTGTNVNDVYIALRRGIAH